MSTEIDNIYQLLFSQEENVELVLQLLRNRPELKKQVEQDFAVVLEGLGKKSFRSVLTLLEKARKQELTTSKEKLAALSHPKLAKYIRKLSLARLKMTALPDMIQHLEQVTSLDLRENKLVVLHPHFDALQALGKLYLDHNKFKTFPVVLTKNKQLHYLSFNDNQLKALPNTIADLQELEYLYLANNRLEELPDEVAELNQLRLLNLSENKIHQLPTSLKQLTKLRELYLWSWKNTIRKLPEDLPALSSLTRISLVSRKPISNLQILGDCQQLTHISLGLAHTEVPEEIGKLQQLKDLSICANRDYSINQLPKSITQLKNLKHLTVLGHSIKKAEQKRIREALPSCYIAFG